MLGKQMTKLIIICDDKTKEYANYLRQLISVNDDVNDEIVGVKDGTVDAVVWTEEEYKQNAATISSIEHVLFVGENKTSKSEIHSMKIRFKRFGMSYGWLGKRAMMMIDDSILSQSEYNEFLEFCASYKQYFEKNAYEEKSPIISDETDVSSSENEDVTISELTPVKPEKKKGFIIDFGMATTFIEKNILKPVADFAENAVSGVNEQINKPKVKKTINNQQYKALTVIFYLDALKEFLEG